MLSLRITFVPFLLLGAVGCSSSSRAKQADEKGDPKAAAVAQELTTDSPAGPAQAAKPKDKTEKLEPFTSKQHGFSVLFPKRPEESKREVKGQGVAEFVVRSKSGNLFLVAASAAPMQSSEYVIAMSDWLPEGIKNKNGVSFTVGFVERGKKRIPDIVMTSADGAHCRHWTFNANSKTYVVLCAGKTKAAAFGEEAHRFLYSFSVLDGAEK